MFDPVVALPDHDDIDYEAIASRSAGIFVAGEPFRRKVITTPAIAVQH